jgi:hypothetical protein
MGQFRVHYIYQPWIEVHFSEHYLAPALWCLNLNRKGLNILWLNTIEHYFSKLVIGNGYIGLNFECSKETFDSILNFKRLSLY